MSKFAVITQAGAATTEVVAAVAGKCITVWSYTLVQNSGNAVFKSATTALTGVMEAGTSRCISAGGGPPLFQCASGEALNLVTTTAAAMGHLTYTLE